MSSSPASAENLRARPGASSGGHLQCLSTHTKFYNHYRPLFILWVMLATFKTGMEITYLKRMLDNPTIGTSENLGITEAEIEAMQSKIGHTFPKAYREFLWLGGRHNNLGGMGMCVVNEKLNWPYAEQQMAHDELAAEGFSLARPYWVLADADGCEQFHFFYFDEGDDPPVYFYCSYLLGQGDAERPGFEKLYDTFSDYVNNRIKTELMDLRWAGLFQHPRK